MNSMTCPVMIQVDANWEKIRQLYSMMLSMALEKKYTSVELNAYEQDSRYDFANLGSLVYGDQLSTGWGTISGKILTSQLPWINTARNLFQDINFQNVAYSKSFGNIEKHSDIPIVGERQKPQCKINYIIATQDAGAITRVYDPKDETIIEEYPSIPGQAFLLDVNCPHEVICTGEREVLQFKFLDTFDNLKCFFNNKPPIFLK